MHGPRKGTQMVRLRDWLPRYPANDPRNAMHRAAYDRMAGAYPESTHDERQNHADRVMGEYDALDAARLREGGAS